MPKEIELNSALLSFAKAKRAGLSTKFVPCLDLINSKRACKFRLIVGPDVLKVINDGSCLYNAIHQKLINDREAKMPQLFTIQSINALSGSRFIFNLKPMPHREACTVLSKMTKHKEGHLSLLAVNGGYYAN